MEIIYFTASGILLYVASDWILKTIEQKRGQQLPQRNIVFFLIIMTLSVSLFQGIQHFIAPQINTNSTSENSTDIIREGAQ